MFSMWIHMRWPSSNSASVGGIFCTYESSAQEKGAQYTDEHLMTFWNVFAACSLSVDS